VNESVVPKPSRDELHTMVGDWLLTGRVLGGSAEIQEDGEEALAPAIRNLVLRGLGLDWEILEESLDSVQVKEAAGIAEEEPIRVAAQRVWHELLPRESDLYISPDDSIRQALVRRCIGCAVNRGVAELHGKATLIPLVECTGLTQGLVQGVLERLASCDSPIVERSTVGRHMFALTEAALALPFSASKRCEELEFRAPNALRPPGAEKVQVRYRRPTDPNNPFMSRQEVTERYIDRCCQDKMPGVREALSVALGDALKYNVLTLGHTARGPKPYSDAVEWDACYVRIGSALRKESEAMQRAILYRLGLSRFVYGAVPSRQDVVQAVGHFSSQELDEYIENFLDKVYS